MPGGHFIRFQLEVKPPIILKFFFILLIINFFLGWTLIVTRALYSAILQVGVTILEWYLQHWIMIHFSLLVCVVCLFLPYRARLKRVC
jgi:hypothetical protein